MQNDPKLSRWRLTLPLPQVVFGWFHFLRGSGSQVDRRRAYLKLRVVQRSTCEFRSQAGMRSKPFHIRLNLNLTAKPPVVTRKGINK